MQDNMDTIKLVVALRCARAAVGMSQEEMADLVGIPKTTLARVETMEGSLRADQLSRILRLFRDLGVDLEFLYSDEVELRVTIKGLQSANSRLLDENRRRSDRKQRAGGIKGLAIEMGLIESDK